MTETTVSASRVNAISRVLATIDCPWNPQYFQLSDSSNPFNRYVREFERVLLANGIPSEWIELAFALTCEIQLKRQRRSVNRPQLAGKIIGKQYLCDGRSFRTRAGAMSHARSVARLTSRMTYECGLSGSYEPDITVALVRECPASR